jgi:hypothetical protein
MMYERYGSKGWHSHPPLWVGQHEDDEDCDWPPRHHSCCHDHQHFHDQPPFPEKCFPAVTLLAQAAELALAAPGALAWCAADAVKGTVGFARQILCDCLSCQPWPESSCHSQKWPHVPHSPLCHPDWRCCPKPLKFHRPSTDLSLRARENEKRISSILIENNMPDMVTIKPTADPWRDAWGRAISGSDMQFQPATLVIDPHKSETLLAITEIEPNSLEGGKVYFTQIHLPETRAKPLLVSLIVLRETQHDAFRKTDPCRCLDSRWVEVCYEPDDPWWLCCHKCGCSPCRCGSWSFYPSGHDKGGWGNHPWWSSCQWHSLSGHRDWF